MYSKNDYRYYLENQLSHSDDFLAHYGVKGMKWKVHKIKYDTGDTRGRGLRISNDETNQSVGLHYATWKNGKNKPMGRALVYTKDNPLKNKKNSKMVDKTRGRLNVFGDSDGSYKEVTLDLSKKKKKKRKSIKQRYMDHLKKTQKIDVISFKDQRTGKEYKKGPKK